MIHKLWDWHNEITFETPHPKIAHQFLTQVFVTDMFALAREYLSDSKKWLGSKQPGRDAIESFLVLSGDLSIWGCTLKTNNRPDIQYLMSAKRRAGQTV